MATEDAFDRARSLNAGRSKYATNVFRFLREFHALRVREILDYRHRKWSMMLDELAEHESVIFDVSNPASFLTVTRVELTDAPTPPIFIAHRIEGVWRKPIAEPLLAEIEPDETSQEPDEGFHRVIAEEQRVWDDYLASWRNWAVGEWPRYAAFQLYEELYGLRTQLQLEPDANDLYIGDGILVWLRNGQEIRHPILLQRIEIAFDPEEATIRLGVAGADPELFHGAMSGADKSAVAAFARFREELDRHDDIWPLAEDPTKSFLKRLANSVSNGVYESVYNPVAPATERPTIARAPMILQIPRGDRNGRLYLKDARPFCDRRRVQPLP